MKYEMTERSQYVEGRLLWQIVALRDIAVHGVKVGDKGGWIQSQENLRQDGDCWISPESSVFAGAVVMGNAIVDGRSFVREGSRVQDNARLLHSCLDGYVVVSGNSSVSSSMIGGEINIAGDSLVNRVGWLVSQATVKDAKIHSSDDVVFVSNVGPCGKDFSAYRRQTDVGISYLHFSGSLEDFKTEVRKKNVESLLWKEYEREHNAIIAFVESKFCP